MSGGWEGAWIQRAAPREWVRRRWLFTPVVDEPEEARFEALGGAQNVGDGAPRVHAETALMALVYACASGWKAGSPLFDEAEGLELAEVLAASEQVLLVRFAKLVSSLR